MGVVMRDKAMDELFDGVAMDTINVTGTDEKKVEALLEIMRPGVVMTRVLTHLPQVITKGDSREFLLAIGVLHGATTCLWRWAMQGVDEASKKRLLRNSIEAGAHLEMMKGKDDEHEQQL